MKSLLTIMFSTAAAIVMLIPAASLAYPMNSINVISYTENGITIAMSDSSTNIELDGQYLSTSWVVDQVSPAGLIKENLNHIGLKRIKNNVQDSVVKVLSNKNVKVAEIYSFSHGTVDATIAIKNRMNDTGTFTATFVMDENKGKNYMTTGYRPSSFSLPVSASNVVKMLGSQDWGISNSHIKISWRNEMSLFHSGIVAATQTHNLISLPFGPFSLMHNSTYSIDPKISGAGYSQNPQCVAPPGCSACPCGGGGGDPDGDYDTDPDNDNPPPTYYAPGSTSIVSVSPNVIMPNGNVTITTTTSSLGNDGPDYLHYQAYNETSGTWTSIGSKGFSTTGDVQFTWNNTKEGISQYDWSQVKAYASNNKGSGGAGTYEIYSETNSPNEIQKMFSDNGTTIGWVVNSLDLANPYDTSTNTTHESVDTGISTIFIPNGGYTVNSINMTNTWIKGSWQIDPYLKVDSNPTPDFYFQNYTLQNATGLENEIIQAFGIGLEIAAKIVNSESLGTLGDVIGALALIEAISGDSTTLKGGSLHDQYYYYANAGFTPPNNDLCGRIGPPYCENQYNALGTYYGPLNQEFNASYAFDLYFEQYYSVAPGGNSNHPYMGDLQFVASYEVSMAPYHNNLYGGAFTLPYTLGGVLG